MVVLPSSLSSSAVNILVNISDGGTHFMAAATTSHQESANIEWLLGPRRQDLIKVIPVTIIYVIIFITGLIGNISTCIVIARNRYMHTATNYCLFNLAVSDLLMLVLGLPQETYTFWSAYPWIFGETFCVLRTLAAETSTYASILTITAFTIERYVAICHPVKARVSNSGLQRAVKLVILIWIVSGLCSIPIVVQYGIVYVQDSNGRDIPDSATCSIPQDRYLSHAFEASTFLFFIIPLAAIGILYGLIGLAIRRSARLTRAGSDTSTRSAFNPGLPTASVGLVTDRTEQRTQHHLQTRARLAVIKMLVAVVVAFFICWAPFHTQRLISVYRSSSPSMTSSSTTDTFELVAAESASLVCSSSSLPPPSVLLPPLSVSLSPSSVSLPPLSVSSSPPSVSSFDFRGYFDNDTSHDTRATSEPFPVESEPSHVHAVLFYMSGILYYVSAVINPILYNIMSLKFRRAFRTTLCHLSYRPDGKVVCRCCCVSRQMTNSSTAAAAAVAATHKRHRGATAYRFSGHGQVQMIRVEGDGSERLGPHSVALGSAAAHSSAGAVAGAAVSETSDQRKSVVDSHDRYRSRNGLQSNISGCSATSMHNNCNHHHYQYQRSVYKATVDRQRYKSACFCNGPSSCFGCVGLDGIDHCSLQNRCRESDAFDRCSPAWPIAAAYEAHVVECRGRDDRETAPTIMPVKVAGRNDTSADAGLVLDLFSASKRTSDCAGGNNGAYQFPMGSRSSAQNHLYVVNGYRHSSHTNVINSGRLVFSNYRQTDDSNSDRLNNFRTTSAEWRKIDFENNWSRMKSSTGLSLWLWPKRPCFRRDSNTV